jgi:hypothetical protein
MINLEINNWNYVEDIVNCCFEILKLKLIITERGKK